MAAIMTTQAPTNPVAPARSGPAGGVVSIAILPLEAAWAKTAAQAATVTAASAPPTSSVALSAGTRAQDSCRIYQGRVFAHGQAEVVANNISVEITGRGKVKAFDGGGSCFLMTGGA
jgi:hypothetical protein